MSRHVAGECRSFLTQSTCIFICANLYFRFHIYAPIDSFHRIFFFSNKITLFFLIMILKDNFHLKDYFISQTLENEINPMTHSCNFADALQQGASQFEQQAGKLKRKFWLQNLKVNVKFYKRIYGNTLVFQ